jgi:vitamin B12 transporter
MAAAEAASHKGVGKVDNKKKQRTQFVWIPAVGFGPIATAIAFACVGAPNALAATAAEGQTLEEVTVQANSLEDELPQELAKSGTRVDVITAAEIKNTGAIDVAKALESLAPGLFLSPKNGPFDYVDASFQGSRTGDILWLVDGVRINNRLYNGTTPLDTLPASMIERIEIIEGGQALFYGTQAVAGAINIVTKAFSKTPDGALTGAGDTNNGWHLDGFARDAVGANQFVLYGSADKSTGLRIAYLVDPSGVLWHVAQRRPGKPQDI